MKKSYIALYFLCIVCACGREESFSSLNGRWRLIAYQQMENSASNISIEPSELNGSVEITFSDDGTTGTLSGHTVTNQVFGKYSLQPGGFITIIEFGGTMVGEPEWGIRFWQTFGKAEYYEAYADRLIIYYKQGTGKMIFERK